MPADLGGGMPIVNRFRKRTRIVLNVPCVALNLKVMTLAESIAATPVIYQTALGKDVKSMTHEQFESERLYRTAIAVAKSMLLDGIIDQCDFDKIDALLVAEFRPIIAGINP